MSKHIMVARDWLKRLDEHQDDDRWLSSSEDELYQIVEGGLLVEPEFHDAVEILIRVFPHFALVLYHLRRWSPLLFNALVEAQNLRDNAMQVRILTHLGSSYFTGGKNAAAQDAFQIALHRAQDEQFSEMMLAAYIGLIRLQYVHVPEPLEADVVNKALALNKQVHELGLKASLHEALALVYSRSTDTSHLAIGHGETAYGYWSRLGNQLEMANTAYLIAASYRFAGELNSAQRWLHQAASLFEKTDYQRQYTLVAVEQGTLYWQRGENDSALQWLNMGLQEAMQIGAKDYMASAYHSLGLTYINLQQYLQAEENLVQAIALWKEVGDYFEIASVHEALGYMEIQRGNHELARRWLEDGLLMCPEIPHHDQRAYREKKIRALLSDIS